MKKFSVALIVLLIFCTSKNIANCALQDKIQLKGPVTIKETSSNSEAETKDSVSDNPFLNSYVNGMTNMINGMSGNSYNLQEQQKQQSDYAKQQFNR